MSQYPPGPPGGEPPQGQQPPPQYPQQPPQQPYQQPPQQYPQQYQQYPPGQPPYQSGPSGPRANFGQRLAAYLIDTVILLIPYFILSALLGASLFNFSVTVNESTGEVSGADAAAGIGTVFLFIILITVLYVGYFAYFEGGPSGQTLGKKAMSIRVIRQDTGGPLGYGLGIGRYFARILSSFLCGLGYLWMLWDQQKQTWHDKLTKTIVVPTAAYPVNR